MPIRSAFLDKLIERLDRLDPESVQTQFLRLAQDRGLLETIFQSIQEGVIVIDGSGRLTYANHAAEELLGFTAESARGRPAGRYLRDIDWERVLSLDGDEWSRLITREIEISYPEHRFISFYVVPLALDDAGEEGAVVILRDVTRDRENEATLMESERLNAVKLLAAGVAHEIGNPLNALDIHLQLIDREIRNGPDDGREELSELVQVARNEVGRLDMIITQFLHAVRPSKPKLAASKIESILNETISLLKQEIQDRGIDVQINYADELPKIRVDRNQIKQAFFNVLRNALQAMPNGGSLTITLKTSDRYLAIAFEDTGGGIAPEDFGRVFEPYQTTKAGGSGLGLMIVQRIVQEHGGQIELQSKPGQGTNFVILLPLAERRYRLLRAAGGSGEKDVVPEEVG